MSDSPASMPHILKVQPTESELNLIARLRQIKGMCVYDAESKTLWVAGKPEYCNGKRYAQTGGNFWIPIDTG